MHHYINSIAWYDVPYASLNRILHTYKIKSVLILWFSQMALSTRSKARSYHSWYYLKIAINAKFQFNHKIVLLSWGNHTIWKGICFAPRMKWLFELISDMWWCSMLLLFTILSIPQINTFHKYTFKLFMVQCI